MENNLEQHLKDCGVNLFNTNVVINEKDGTLTHVNFKPLKINKYK